MKLGLHSKISSSLSEISIKISRAPANNLKMPKKSLIKNLMEDEFNFSIISKELSSPATTVMNCSNKNIFLDRHNIEKK
jgi:hypothetical protein